MKEGVKFPRGTQVCCPVCRRFIAEAKRDIMGFEAIVSAPWAFAEDLQPALGGQMKCSCGAQYVSKVAGRTELHTDRGWM